MNMDADDIVLERPVIATFIVALVAALTYVGIQLALDGSVAPAETASFVLIFTIIYVAGNRFLRERAEDGTDNSGGDAAGDENRGDTTVPDAADSTSQDAVE